MAIAPALARAAGILRTDGEGRVMRQQGLAAVAMALAAGFAPAADARDYVKRDDAQLRAYSPAVVTEGGKIIWLAGQGAPTDSTGKSLAGDFDGQVRETFARLDKTLKQAGG